MKISASGLELSALESALDERPDIAIMTQYTAQALLLRPPRPGTGFVVLTPRPTGQYGLLLLGLGASCVAQGASLDEIHSAVLYTAQGGRVFIAAPGQKLDRTELPRNHPITRRELEVLTHISQGHSYGQTAFALGITDETVRTYTNKLRHKLGATQRKDLLGIPVPRGTLPASGSIHMPGS